MNKILVMFVLMNATTCIAGNLKWSYGTLSGSEKILELSKDGHISITSGDVTTNEIECSDGEKFSLCINMLRMSLVVPSPNELNKFWRFGDGEFILSRRFNKFKILGSEFKDVLFIQARKKVYKDIHRSSSFDVFHEFVFTYKNGLLAYRETDERFLGGEFFVSDKLCNIGGTCLGKGSRDVTLK